MITEYTAGCAAAGIHGGRAVKVTDKYPDKTLSRCHLSRISREEMMFRSRSTPKIHLSPTPDLSLVSFGLQGFLAILSEF